MNPLLTVLSYFFESNNFLSSFLSNSAILGNNVIICQQSSPFVPVKTLLPQEFNVPDDRATPKLKVIPWRHHKIFSLNHQLFKMIFRLVELLTWFLSSTVLKPRLRLLMEPQIFPSMNFNADICEEGVEAGMLVTVWGKNVFDRTREIVGDKKICRGGP